MPPGDKRELCGAGGEGGPGARAQWGIVPRSPALRRRGALWGHCPAGPYVAPSREGHYCPPGWPRNNSIIVPLFAGLKSGLSPRQPQQLPGPDAPKRTRSPRGGAAAHGGGAAIHRGAGRDPGEAAAPRSAGGCLSPAGSARARLPRLPGLSVPLR